MKKAAFPIACGISSGIALALAYGIWGQWWLAWFAPVPVLAYAFGRTNPMVAIMVALVAPAIGAAGELLPYVGVISFQTFGAAIALKAIAFAACVMLARFAGRGLYPVAAPICFAALWTGWDFLASFGPDGALLSPAYSQASFPVLAQSASLGGMWLVTFLLGLVSGLVALAFAVRSAMPSLLAAGIFALNIAYGAVRNEFPAGDALTRVVLIDSDLLAEASAIDRVDIALGAVIAYADEARIVGRHAALIVLPENIAIVRRQWRQAAINQLRQASFATGATIVAGFDVRDGRKSDIQTWVFAPDAPPRIFGAHDFAPGSSLPAPFMRASQFGGEGALIEAASHMYFPAMLHSDAVRTHAPLVVVPAWDFGIDADAQSLIALMRSIENGFALVRNARDGKMLLSDRMGRIAAARETGDSGFSTLSASVPTASGSGFTLYDRIGDSFAWACVAMAAMMISAAFVRILFGWAGGRDLRALPFGNMLRPAWTASPWPESFRGSSSRTISSRPSRKR